MLIPCQFSEETGSSKRLKGVDLSGGQKFTYVEAIRVEDNAKENHLWEITSVPFSFSSTISNNNALMIS